MTNWQIFKRVAFERSGGHYMFYTGALYFAVGMYCIFVNDFVPIWLAQVAWIVILCVPFAIPPFGRWLNMNITWDQNMINFFGKKEAKDNVYNLPTPKVVPPMPEVKKEEPAKTYFRLGLTDNNRVSFQMGYGEITMNYEGCQQMIDQLTFFQSQLYDDGPSGGPDGDGGEPIPVPEQKAA